MALQFVEQFVSKTTPNWLSTRWIHHTDNLGQANKPISDYLKNKLLICVDSYYNKETGKCKTYVQNVDGVNELKQALGIKQLSAKITSELQTQLDTGEFEYNDSSDRLFNPLQNLPKQIKRNILSNNSYNYNYDIVCAAPTLLYQHAQRQGLIKKLEFIEFYISNRTDVRNEICIKYNLDSKQVKQLINSLFLGAYLSLDHRTSAYKLLNGDYNKIKQLKSDQFLLELRNDIKSMWKSITPQMKLDLNKKRISSRDKSSKYRELEREVMDVIKGELRRTKNKHLLQHDGWTCKEVCDINMLRSYVRSHTGFVIDIDWEIFVN
jgi:hypothetical protein